jgi:uncharacterized protein (DUF58 family)
LDAENLRVVARRDVATGLAGAYRSAFRGRGLVFEELREYGPGDDVRWIEWNATARMARPIIKRMREERDLVVALLVDVSSSLSFGSRGVTKRAATLRIAAALAQSAVATQDRVAAATFADDVIDLVEPGGGPVHLERIFRTLAATSGGAPTDAGPALDWAARTLPRHSLVFLVSDLLFPDPGTPLRRCARKHEAVLLRIADPADTVPPRTAPIRTFAIEGGPVRTVRAHRSPGPSSCPGALEERQLRRLGVDVGTLWTGRRLVGSLRHFLEARSGKAA